MANNDYLTLAWTIMQTTGSLVVVKLSYTTLNGYRLYTSYWNDTGAGDNIYSDTITDAPHYIELMLTKATNSSSNDGRMDWWIDGVVQTAAIGIDNYNLLNDNDFYQELGTADVFATTTGTVYEDEFVLRNDNIEIGPKNPNVIQNRLLMYHYNS
jgi:hypothetical protein